MRRGTLPPQAGLAAGLTMLYYLSMTSRDLVHTPVLVDSVLTGLAIRPDALIVDGTLGTGGHAEAILDAAPESRLLGFDRDPQALEQACARLARFGNRLITYRGSYANMADIVPRLGFDRLDGILLDLGLSSLQLDDARRGFAFRFDGPLDMRFDPTRGQTAADLVNTLPERDLADLIYTYGEERHSRRIARAVVAARPIETTSALADLILRAIPSRQRERIHPATRTFQALRIAVNDELGELERALPQAITLLRPGGRLLVIGYHSLEDRIVKQFLKREAADCLCSPDQLVCTCGHAATVRIVNRKPVEASEEEVARNPRARSAKMRIAEKIR